MATYSDLPTLKGRLSITDTSQDATLSAVLEAVSRQIDDWCGRSFSSGTDTKYLTHEGGRTLFLPFDLLSVTTFATDVGGQRTYATIWDPTRDYDLEPYNAAYELRPYTRIAVQPFSRWWIPTFRKAVQIVGTWGYWTSVPGPISEACLLQAIRLFTRKSSPFGIAGTNALGVVQMITKFDPDVANLLAPFRRMNVAAV
jgi:hypothetical protein